jgi:hypothetical protein
VSVHGSTEWAVRGGGAGVSAGNGVTADAEGAAYVVGTLQGSRATFGPVVLDVADAAAAAAADAFVLKVGPRGTTQWAMRVGGAGADGGRGIAVSFFAGWTRRARW